MHPVLSYFLWQLALWLPLSLAWILGMILLKASDDARRAEEERLHRLYPPKGGGPSSCGDRR